MGSAAPAALTALADALLPADPAPGDGGPAYPSASAAGADRTVAEIVAELPRGARTDFRRLLGAVESPGLNLLLGGRWVRFSRLSAPEREAYLRSMSTSRLALKRRGFQAVKRLVAWAYFSAPLADGSNPLWPRIHYQPPSLPEELSNPMAGLAPSPVAPGGDVSVDVCVVGSGAGGSVVAARAAAAGFSVAVLEAGPWIPSLRYPRIERTGFDQLYLGRGIVPTRDAAISILAGSTAGGSTAINWMTCLPPRPEARREWAEATGALGPSDASFDQAYAKAERRLAVSTESSTVNAANDVLRRGSVSLGYREGPDWAIIPRNAIACADRCGSCVFGCPYGARQSALTTYLADAMRAGARLYARTTADRIDIVAGRATGVRAHAPGPSGSPIGFRVRARHVVVAGGALETPALLLRSDVGVPGVGRGLRLDPTTALVGEFARPVRVWEGPPQTVVVRRFQAPDGGAHGPWIEAAPAHPGLAALATPWAGATDFRRLLGRLEHVATPIVLVRDSGEGRVSIDRDGRPVYDYRLTRTDREGLLRGVVETARILVAAGATRLVSLTTPYVEVGDGSRPIESGPLERWVADVQRIGIRDHSAALFSAHPMGSARLGRDARTSAARPSGAVHGVEGLWIADGSLLPTAPGANPMMSILALADRTADHLLAALGGPAPAHGQG